MDDELVVVKITFRAHPDMTPLKVASALSRFFLAFDVGETRLEFVGGDPDSVQRVKRALMMG